MDDLQFQKAEYGSDTPPCAICKTDLAGDFYRLQPPAKARPGTPLAASYVLCPDCAAKVRELQRAPDSASFGRGLLYGTGMAILCGIGYAIFTLATNWQVGLVAILVGYLVGKAFRTGTRNRGGRRCQIAAVTLTYLAMTLSSAPLILKQLRERETHEAQGQPKDNQHEVNPPTSASTRFDPGRYIYGVILLAGISLASPFLDILSGFGGIIGVVIIFFGMQQAWALTAGDPRKLSGPFSSRTESVPAGAAPLA